MFITIWLISKLIEPTEIINQLFPNLWIFITHIISTSILLILLSKWVYNPFKKLMHERHKKIQELIKNTTEKQKKTIINQKKISELLLTAKIEANNIIIAAKNKAEKKRKKILELTKSEIIQLNKQAHKEIQKEKEQYFNDIKKIIINIAFNIAEQLINKEINKEKNKKLVESFIKELE